MALDLYASMVFVDMALPIENMRSLLYRKQNRVLYSCNLLGVKNFHLG